MQVVTVKSFLAEWAHREKEEFLEAHALPMLVGLGTVDDGLLHVTAIVEGKMFDKTIRLN